MHSTLTSKGQLTLPKAARDLLRLVAGTRVSFEVVGDKLVLTPARVNALSVRGTLKSPYASSLSDYGNRNQILAAPSQISPIFYVNIEHIDSKMGEIWVAEARFEPI